MAEERKPLLLLEFMFGDSVEAASRNKCPDKTRDKPGINSDRLLTWADAFDEWLRELGAKYTKSTTKQARLAWRRLLQEGGEVRGGGWGKR